MESVRQAEAGILRYLIAHQDARDTIEGIEKWWLPQSCEFSVADIAAALERLENHKLICSGSRNPPNRFTAGAARIRQRSKAISRAWNRRVLLLKGSPGPSAICAKFVTAHFQCSLGLSARVAKQADAKDLKSFFRQRKCGFDSRPGHHHCKRAAFRSFAPFLVLFGRYARKHAKVKHPSIFAAASVQSRSLASQSLRRRPVTLGTGNGLERASGANSAATGLPVISGVAEVANWDWI